MRLWSLTRLTDEVTHSFQTALRQGDGFAALRAWNKLEALEGSSNGCNRQRGGTQDEAYLHASFACSTAPPADWAFALHASSAASMRASVSQRQRREPVVEPNLTYWW